MAAGAPFWCGIVVGGVNPSSRGGNTDQVCENIRHLVLPLAHAAPHVPNLGLVEGVHVILISELS